MTQPPAPVDARLAAQQWQAYAATVTGPARDEALRAAAYWQSVAAQTPIAQAPVVQPPVSQAPVVQAPVVQSPTPQPPPAQMPTAYPQAAQTPGAQQPGAYTPSAQQPGAYIPGVQQPGAYLPGTPTPGVQPASPYLPGTPPPGAGYPPATPQPGAGYPPVTATPSPYLQPGAPASYPGTAKRGGAGKVIAIVLIVLLIPATVIGVVIWRIQASMQTFADDINSQAADIHSYFATPSPTTDWDAEFQAALDADIALLEQQHAEEVARLEAQLEQTKAEYNQMTEEAKKAELENAWRNGEITSPVPDPVPGNSPTTGFTKAYPSAEDWLTALNPANAGIRVVTTDDPDLNCGWALYANNDSRFAAGCYRVDYGRVLYMFWGSDSNEQVREHILAHELSHFMQWEYQFQLMHAALEQGFDANSDWKHAVETDATCRVLSWGGWSKEIFDASSSPCDTDSWSETWLAEQAASLGIVVS